MHLSRLCIIILSFSVHLSYVTAYSLDSLNTCHKAFFFKYEDYAVANTMKICSNTAHIPTGYEADINMVVCEDKLCANVILKFNWDLAGNYVRFDTIQGKSLTKFDHKRFTDDDYKKLDQIIKDKNSVLRILKKEDLIDKSIKLKSTTVDAVTGATQSTIKNAVVEGAVYSSFALWHFVNSVVKDNIQTYTLSIYSEQVANQILSSDNYDTQLFALKQLSGADYETHFVQLIQVLSKSVPLIKAYIIGKAPLPFLDEEKNRKFVSLFPELDCYSKSVFIDRITADKKLATILLPLMIPQLHILDKKQLNQYLVAYQKFHISGFLKVSKIRCEK